jgi:hypothetical protein
MVLLQNTAGESDADLTETAVLISRGLLVIADGSGN